MDDLVLDSANTITFVMIDSSGTEVASLGAGFILQVSKNGGAFAGSAGTKAEIGNGWYSYIATAGECDTAGPLSIRVTGAGCVQQNLVYNVKQATADSVWASSTRTLTQSAASTESTTTSKITRTRGSTWTITISGLSVSGYTTIDFVLKGNEDDVDTDAILWVRKNASGSNDGLLRINGAAISSPYASTDASIAVAGDSASVTITVKPIATANIDADRYAHTLQTLISSVVDEPSSGTFVVSGDIARTVY